uniref:Uncharacterized protein n=1 Tax=Brassica oleracea TaxID=3712 RepID=A0A3P6GJT2_BRAOL|nr:unnamed protein product [Brassica oleracea]
MMPHDFMVCLASPPPYLASSSSIPPPFPWATNKRGTIQSLENLESKQITTITGEVQCRPLRESVSSELQSKPNC